MHRMQAFLRDGQWIEPTLRYSARDLVGIAANDDDPGRGLPGRDISGATFYNHVTYSAAWDALSESQKDAFKRHMPFYRAGRAQPTVSGYSVDDKTDSSGGRALTSTCAHGDSLHKSRACSSLRP